MQGRYKLTELSETRKGIDLEFDECSGQIRKLFVPNGNKFLNFLCCEPDYCIPYKDIRQIGPDIIIVDIKC